MRVALFISPKYTVPPFVQRILAPWYLTEDIANRLSSLRNVEVVLFAAKGSRVKCKLIHGEILPVGLPNHYDTQEEHYHAVFKREKLLFEEFLNEHKKQPFDVFHGHQIIHLSTMLAQAKLKIPCVITLHDPMNEERFVTAQIALQKNPNIHYVSISNSQRDSYPLPWATTVYNGTDHKMFIPVQSEQSYIAVIGRMVEEKGILDSIKASTITDIPIILVGAVTPETPKNIQFWQEKVLPFINQKNVHYFEFKSRLALVPLYARAKALLLPLNRQESFGLAMIEALSCGTPVIAYNRASVPEIVQDGVNGFIVEPDDGLPKGISAIPHNQLKIKQRGVAGLVAALRQIDEIDRNNCRKSVLQKFTTDKMVSSYYKLYQKLLNLPPT